MKLRSIAFVVILSLLLVGPGMLFVASKAGIDLPDQLTAESAKYLSGGINDADVSSTANLEGFVSESFQNAVEAEIGNFIPAKAFCMLNDAELQRTFIRMSNSVFDFECYPTYFGSKYIETSDREHVLELSYKSKVNDLERFRSFVEDINNFAAQFPEIDIVLCLVDGTGWSDANPSYQYVSNTPGDEFVETNLIAQLDDRIRVVGEMDYDTPSYFERFLPAEHHWNFVGWSEAYNSMANELAWNTFEDCPVVTYDDFDCIGAEARAGLDLSTPPFHLTDYDVQFECLKYYVNGDRIEEPGQKGLMEYDNLDDKTELQYLGYWAYYGPNYPELLIENKCENLEKSEKAVLITNSHGKPLIPYIASNYQSLKKYDSFNQVVDINLVEMAEQGEIDDLIFVFEPAALTQDTLVESSLFS